MYQNYLITGATGFLGSVVVQLLLLCGCRVLALVKNSDPLICTLPKHVAVFYGDLTDKESLRDFFAAGGDDFCVLHCAGLISIASKPDEALYAVNVQGTQNIVDLCREFGAGRLIYVSSVHAIPEKPAPETITEPDRFAPDGILGDYGKSKAMATALVLDAAQSGLNASVVLPSGILGPGDLARGNMTRMLLSFCRGRLPLGVEPLDGTRLADLDRRAEAYFLKLLCQKRLFGACPFRRIVRYIRTYPGRAASWALPFKYLKYHLKSLVRHG